VAENLTAAMPAQAEILQPIQSAFFLFATENRHEHPVRFLPRLSPPHFAARRVVYLGLQLNAMRTEAA